MVNNKDLFEESKKYLCGGVNSPVRAMKPYPFFTERAKGAMLLDVEGNSYIDYCLCYGPMMLGHKNLDNRCSKTSVRKRNCIWNTY